MATTAQTNHYLSYPPDNGGATVTQSEVETGNYLKITSFTNSTLSLDMQSFLLDAKASGLAAGTLKYYRLKLRAFHDFLVKENIQRTDEIEAEHIRRFLVTLQEKHTTGGIHSYYTAIRTWFRWLMREGLIATDPSTRVRRPRITQEILEPVNLEHLKAMLETCDKNTVVGLRDTAILLVLLDSGLRAGELLALNVGDVDLQTGTVLVRKSKSRKPRATFIGPRTRRAVIAYMRARGQADDKEPLWIAYRSTGERERLTYGGLRDLMRRRAEIAGVPTPTLHSFRRAFALTMLRSGADVVSLSRMMGHGSLPVLMRYLKQEAQDLGQVHETHSPVQNLGLPHNNG